MKRETGRRVQQLLFVVVVSCLLFTLPMYLEADAEAKNSETTTQQSKSSDKQDDTNNKDSTITNGIRIMSAAPTIIVCFGYFALILLARYFWISLPNKRYLQAYADAVGAQFAIEQDKPDKESKVEKAIKPEIMRLLSEILNLVPKDTKWYCWRIAGTGKQLAGWRRAHEAKRLTTDILNNDDAYAQALVASEELNGLDTKPSKVLSKKITDAIESNDHKLIKSLLKRAQEMLFEARDSYYEMLADWQNKVMWLVMTALLIVFVLAITFGNTVFFALGAVGGLLSRMRNIISRSEIGFDYGVSWSTLFIAPVVGALTGWAGVLLLVLAGTELLGPAFEFIKTTDWNKASTKQGIWALALVFGFSASFFDRMMERMESTLKKGPASKNKTSNSKNEGE